jgi:ubiquinone/menaquinone biosynthesis C-methylase UbiE
MPDPFSFISRFYDRFAGRPDPGPLQHLLALQPGQRLLDLGGGTGRLAQALDVPAVICDLSAGMVQEAGRKGLAACRARAETLPFADRTFDGLLVVDAFHHFADQQQAAREMLRVLRPAGRLVMREPDIRRWLVRSISRGERLLGLTSRMLAPAELAALLVQQGGEVLSIGESGLSFYLVATHKDAPLAH